MGIRPKARSAMEDCEKPHGEERFFRDRVAILTVSREGGLGYWLVSE